MWPLLPVSDAYIMLCNQTHQAVLSAATAAALLLARTAACLLLRCFAVGGLSHLNTAAGRNFA